MMWHTCN